MNFIVSGFQGHLKKSVTWDQKVEDSKQVLLDMVDKSDDDRLVNILMKSDFKR